MGKIYSGTSGWSYASWKPEFYPEKLASAKFLSYYASRLNSVEVNYTFRHFPTSKLLGGWISATPEDFKFSLKAPQTITHIKRLREAWKLASDFFAALEPLQTAKKLGSALFQLPPNLKCDVSLLKDFLDGLPHSVRIAFEFRHASWFCEEIFTALRDANVAMCRAESEKLESPEVQTAGFSYFRLRKPSYSAQFMSDLRRKVAELLPIGDAFIYFKHEETPAGAFHAQEMLENV